MSASVFLDRDTKKLIFHIYPTSDRETISLMVAIKKASVTNRHLV